MQTGVRAPGASSVSSADAGVLVTVSGDAPCRDRSGVNKNIEAVGRSPQACKCMCACESGLVSSTLGCSCACAAASILMQLCLHVHQHERVLVSIYVCAVHVSLVGPCQEASVAVYLYV